jgi:hypothetical protein
MVREQVVERSALSHSDALRSGIVILGYLWTCIPFYHFIVIPYEVGGGRAKTGRDDRFYPLAIAIVGERRIAKY